MKNMVWLFLLLIPVNLGALEIPLDELGTQKETSVLAYVDMDRILRSCQQSEKVQQEISALRENYEKEEKELQEKIAAGEKEIADLSAALSALRVSTATLSENTTTVLNLPGVSEDHSAELADRQKQLTEKKTEIENLRQTLSQKKEEHRAAIADRENQICNEKIVQVYKILEKLSTEENIAIIVNKENILYGPAHRDLTDKVIRILNNQ